MPDLTMYVPTKGRAHNAARLQQKFNETIACDSRLVFILSDNDSTLREYLNVDFSSPPVVVSPQVPGFVNPLNLGYLMDSTRSFAVGFMGDDHLPQTEGWDESFLESLRKLGSGLVYGNDKLQEHRIPTHIAMTSDIPETLGFMTLPRLQHLYADNFWLDIGNALNRITYLPDVIIEHLHPGAGKAIVDAGYLFSGNSQLDTKDAQTYFEYLQHAIKTDVAKLLKKVTQ